MDVNEQIDKILRLPEVRLDGADEIQVVECSQCQKLHRVDSLAYVLLQCNVTIGNGGGIIGNNFVNIGPHRILRSVTPFCKACLINYLQEKFEE